MCRCGAAAAAEHRHAGAQHVRDQGDKFLRCAVVDGFAVHDLRHSGVGLGDKRHAGVLAQTAQLGQHLLRPRRAVQTEGVDAHALQHHQRRRHIAAGDAAAVLIAGEGDKNRLVADAAHRQHRGAGVGQRHHSLDDEQIHTGAFQAGGLLGVDIHQLLEGHVAQRGEERAGGGDVSRPQRPAAGGLLRQGCQTAVIVLRAVEDAVLLQLAPVGAEGGGVQHLAAAVHIAALDVDDGLRVLQCPLLGAHIAGIAALLQLGAGGTVQYQGKMKLHILTSA